jgi:hypothetical protein
MVHICENNIYPQNYKGPDFARGEKACRNDVEREFGVLQAHWDILWPCKNMKFEHNVGKCLCGHAQQNCGK